MIITHDIGSLAARIKLTAVAGHEGGVIRSGLEWRLKGAKQVYTSLEAEPVLDLLAGTYEISLSYQSRVYEWGVFSLAKNTQIDLLFSLADEIDFDVTQNFERRLADRQAQERFGHAELPLHDPNAPKGDQPGVHFQGHPLLNTAQFDGMEAKISPQPDKNEEASERTLEHILQQKKQLQSNPNSLPKLTR